MPHPSLETALATIDFMFEYVNVYMELKPKWLRNVTLNIYGGESMYYPNIDKILEEARLRHEKYKDFWNLDITTTTNLILSHKILEKIYNDIDEFTISYHTESTENQRNQLRENLLFLKNKNKRIKVIVLMHPNTDNWDDCLSMINFCNTNNIKNLPRQLDHELSDVKFNYSDSQVEWFKNFYNSRSHGEVKFDKPVKKDEADNNDLSDYGRSCCGGRQLCTNGNFKERKGFVVGNNFKDWHCTVNWFFLSIKQVTGEIFTNRDCKMNLNSEIGPIGKLEDSAKIIEDLKTLVVNKRLPVIKCANSTCFCGLCAPKSSNKEKLLSAFEKYTAKNVFQE